ncbi:MAG: hypothetical protein V7754_07425 [Halioglobus sp.]
MTAKQTSKLLSSLFSRIDIEERLTVLHIGPALPETVEYFSNFRCKLFFVDLFSELPQSSDEEGAPSLEEQFAGLLDFPEGTKFDLCLFWDIFNFLDSIAIAAFLGELRPYVTSSTLAHGFAAYKRSTPQTGHLYGIADQGTVNIRPRGQLMSTYTPHAQNELKSRLDYFGISRSVLLPDSRLELLFSISQPGKLA